MDRVNRRFLVVSTLIAIPAALLMASLSIGTNPEVPFSSQQASIGSGVRNAIGQSPSEHDQVIQQVIGKQPDSRRSRGLFSRGSSSSKRVPATDEPLGLFGALFGRRTASSNERMAPAANPAVKSTEDVDWNGIPYHDVHGNRSKSLAKPVRPPSPTRVIRRGNNNGKTASSATSTNRGTLQPARSKSPTIALAIPKPPSENDEAVNKAPRRFSSSESSRRRPVAIAAKANQSGVASIYSTATKEARSYRDEDVADLVPRVSRKAIRPATVAKDTKNAAKTSVAAKTTNPKPASSKVSDAKIASKKPTNAKALAKTADPKPSTKGDPPKAQLQTPTIASVRKTTPPAYSKPVDPKTTEVPAQPAYAASGGIDSVKRLALPNTPAASVSHRAGPPAAAFVPIQQPTEPSPNRFSAIPKFEDRSVQNHDGFQAVGSGVAGPGFKDPSASDPSASDLSASDLSASDPVYETAQTPRRGGSTYDPYGSRGTYQSPSLSTFGQRLEPVAPLTPAQRTLAAPAESIKDASNIPMHSIPGYGSNLLPGQKSVLENRVVNRSSNANVGIDNFNNAGDNRMRSKSAAVAKIPAQGAHIVTSELPGIRVVTHGPSEVMIRQNNEYEIRVENRGSIDAKGVLVRALIPDWADVQGKNASVGDIDSQGEKGSERLVWIIDNLPAGKSEIMYVRLMAARSGTYNLDVDWTMVPQRSIAKVHVHEPRLELAIEGPDQVIYGHSQTYKVRVLNPGDGMAPNVVFTLSPNSATPQTQRIGDIPAGKEAQFEVELTAQDLGDLKIQGLAIGDLELRAEGAKTIRVSAAELEAVLGGPELKYQNTEAAYSLQLQNNGSASAERVIAMLRIPAGVKYLGGIEGATQTRDILKWEVSELAPGATRDYQFRCNMAATGEHVLAFDCKGTAAARAAVSIATRVESIADLVLTINDPPAPAPIGSEVLYEIVLRNRGSREAKDVRAIAQFSHGIEPQRVEGQSGEVVTGQVMFDTIPRIGAGEEIHLRVIAQAEKAGHHRFRTEIRSGDTVLVAEEATHFMSPRSDRVSRRSSDAPLTR